MFLEIKIIQEPVHLQNVLLLRYDIENIKKVGHASAAKSS
ncbi:MAG: hypothetical protein RIR48_2488 [Bacteroidota bacterium]|jgi:hypothetical protein